MKVIIHVLVRIFSLSIVFSTLNSSLTPCSFNYVYTISVSFSCSGTPKIAPFYSVSAFVSEILILICKISCLLSSNYRFFCISSTEWMNKSPRVARWVFLTGSYICSSSLIKVARCSKEKSLKDFLATSTERITGNRTSILLVRAFWY